MAYSIQKLGIGLITVALVGTVVVGAVDHASLTVADGLVAAAMMVAPLPVLLLVFRFTPLGDWLRREGRFKPASKRALDADEVRERYGSSDE
ncbi:MULTISPECIES: hypothetical protein [Halobacterium]|uniref:hypothetical protein n=1 Tax=Halobacterium TaxID=2239 RepID=UPI00073EF709|nr:MULTISPECIES: hypothetical protein [Halobacterium]MCG1002887.1 hypothetical protein [Halobacterium noricense]